MNINMQGQSVAVASSSRDATLTNQQAVTAVS